MSALTKLDDGITQFKELMEAGIQNIAKACKLYVSLIDEDTEAAERFRDACPYISEGTWADFELVGRGMMHHELIWGGGRCANKLKALPFSQQKLAMEDGVKVLTSTGDTLTVRPDRMTPFQVRQAFDNGHLRDLAAQRAWLESAKAAPAKGKKAKELEGGFTIHKGQLTVTGTVTFSKADLIGILGRML